MSVKVVVEAHEPSHKVIVEYCAITGRKKKNYKKDFLLIVKMHEKLKRKNRAKGRNGGLMVSYWETMRKKFNEERDDVLLTFDLEKIKKFYKKYRDLLAFPFLPPEDIIYRDSMKDILKMEKATPEQKQRAREWLNNQKQKN